MKNTPLPPATRRLAAGPCSGAVRNTPGVTYPNDSGWAGPAAQQPPPSGQPQAYPPEQYAPQQYVPYAPQPYGQPYPPQAYPGQAYPGPPPGWQGYGYGPAPKNGPGTAALTLGIIALCTFWVPFLYLITSVPCAIIAIVQGSKARRLAAAGWATNGGKAKAGVICAVIAIVLCVLNFLLGIWLSSQLNLN